jgi:Domain of unknown function (DUF4424)
LKTIAIVVAVLSLALLAGPALADDSTAALTNSGLVFTKNAAVEMKSENLYISDKAVRVIYGFLNTSPKDVSLTVAFPVPDLTMDGPDDSINIPDYNSPNFLDFHITVDGKPVQALIEQQAIKNGVNQTAYLKSLGIPISPFYDATPIALAKLPLAQQNALIQQGLAMLLSDPSDPGPRQLIGTWTLKTNFYWSQTFPAGQPVTIEHTYAPSVASTAVLVSSEADLKQCCADADFMASLRKLTPPGEGSVPAVNPEFIHFVLVTGANWAAPIRDFQMTIDKGQPAALVSFCGTGVKKTGPTTFAVHYTNFTPTADVAVLLLEPRPAQ